MILLFIISFLGFSVYYIVMMPIRNIYIIGNNIISDEIIIEEAKIDSYPSFLLTSSAKIKNNIKKNKYVEDVMLVQI